MEAQQKPSFQSAVARAARALGIEAFFLRMVAAELPSEPWASRLLLHREGQEVVALVPHLCDPSCPLTPGECLTALKVEALVNGRGGLHTIASLRPRGRDVEIRLRPFPP